MLLVPVVPALVVCGFFTNENVPRKPEMPGIAFEVNRGQAGDERVRFLARTRQATVFLTDTETVFLMRSDGVTRNQTATLRMTLSGAGARTAPPEVRQPVVKPVFVVDSMIGPPDRWQKSVPAYESVIRRNAYDRIDAVFRGTPNRREMEYDFVVHPGGEPGRIQMRFEGATSVRISAGGELHIETPEGTLIHRKPVAIQAGQSGEIPVKFRKTGDLEVGFAVGVFDPSKELVIDPVVSFSRFYGGTGEDVITAARGLGFAGYTNSAVFPGAGIGSSGGYDAFFVSLGTAPRVAYVGGSGDDKALAVAAQANSGGAESSVDFAIGGETDSPDFPQAMEFSFTTVPLTPQRNPQDFRSRGAGKDAFFLVSVPAQRAMVLKAFGGSGDDRIRAVTFNTGLMFAGESNSPDLPVDTSGIQATHAGGWDGLLGWQLFNTPAISLSYWGGSGDDRLTAANGFFLAGSTDSDDLVLSNALQSRRAGGRDGVLLWVGTSQFNDPATGRQAPPLLATYFGGSGDDDIADILAIPRASLGIHNVLVAGSTTSTDLAPPGTTSAQTYQAAHGGGETDGFVATFAVPIYSATQQQGFPVAREFTYMGGSGADRITGVQMVNGVHYYFSGVTNSADLRLIDPLQAIYGGGASDAFFTGFFADSLTPFLVTYVGGSGADSGAGVGLDTNGQVFLAGTTASGSLPGVDLTPQRGAQAEGFVLGFATTRLAAGFPTFLCRDCRSNLSLPVTRLASGSARVRIRSLDPSLLLLTAGVKGTAESMEFDWDGEQRFIGIGALAESGQAAVSIEVEGLPEARGVITLTPVQHYLESYGPTNDRSRGPVTLPLGSSGVTLTWASVAKLPSGLEDVASFPRSGVGTPALFYEVEDPKILRHLDGTGSGLLAGVAPGTTRVTLHVRGLTVPVPPITVEVTVAAIQINPRALRIASGFLTPVGSVGLGVIARSLDVDAARLYHDGRLASEMKIDSFRTSVLGGLVGATARLEFQYGRTSPVSFSTVVEPAYYGFADAATARLVPGAATTIPVAAGTEDVFESFAPASAASLAPLTFRVTSSNPDVVEVTTPVATQVVSGWVNVGVRALREGEAELRVQAPDGMVVYAGRETKRVIVSPPVTTPPAPRAISFETAACIGKDLQAPAGASFIGTPFPPAGLPIEIAVSDPSRLLLSASVSQPGSAKISVQSGASFYVQSLADQGEVALTLRANGYEDVVRKVPLCRSGLVMRPFADRRMTLLETLPVNVSVYALRPANYWVSNFTNSNPHTNLLPQSLRPGVASNYRVVNRNPEVGQFSGNTFTPVAEGRAVLVLEGDQFQPFEAMSETRITVGRASFPYPSLTDMLIGKDTAVGIGGSRTTLSRLFPMQVVSSDPTKLLLFVDNLTPPSASLEMIPGDAFYVLGMSDSGSAKISVRSDAYPREREFEIGLAPSYFSLNYRFDTRIRETSLPLGGHVDLNVSSNVLNPENFIAPQSVESPFQQFRLPLRNSDPTVASPAVSELVLDRWTVSRGVRVSALKPGTTIIELMAPSGYDSGPAESRKFTICGVQPPTTLPDVTLPKDTQTGISLSTAPPGPVTYTSSDPSRVLLAIPSQADPTSAGGPGQASVTLQPNQGTVLIQALADSGEVTIEARADGMDPVQSSVRLVPLRFGVYGPTPLPTPLTVGMVRRFTVAIAASAETPVVYQRTGAEPVTLRLESSDSAVARVETSEIRFPGQREFTVRAIGPGVTSLELKVANPASGAGIAPEYRQQALQVEIPSIFVGNPLIQVGRDMMQRATAVVANTGFDAVEFTIRSSQPDRVLLSSDANGVGRSEIRVRTPSEIPFYVHGLASSGTVEVVIEGPGFQPAVLEVQLRPTAILFQATSALRLENATPVTIPLLAASIHPSTSQKTFGNLRPGASIQIGITNSNPAAGVLEGVPVRPGPEGSLSFRFLPQPIGGTTVLAIVQPDGYEEPVPKPTLTVQVASTLKHFQWNEKRPVVYGTQHGTQLAFVDRLPDPRTKGTVTSLTPALLRVDYCGISAPESPRRLKPAPDSAFMPLRTPGQGAFGLKCPAMFRWKVPSNCGQPDS